jgi:hypothetical protein
MTEHVDTGRVHSFSDENRELPLMAATTDSVSSETSKEEEKSPANDPETQSPVAGDDVYPGDHGDWRAISCSIGVFFALFVGFGILNIPGTFQTYWELNQLKDYTPSQVGWIAATQFFLTLFGSVFAGRWFDLHGGRVLPLIIDLMVVVIINWIDRILLGFLYGQSVY